MATIAPVMINAHLAVKSAPRNYLGHSVRVPHRNLQLKCMAEPRETSTKEVIPPPAVAPSTTTSNSPRPPKVSTKFGDVFSFSGPAPETINGRLAMVGFVSAIGVELATGRDLFSQLSSGGVSWFVLTAGLLTFASAVPMFKGVSAESKSQAIMSSSAEMWNGRFAMLGLVALAVTEYIQGGPLV